jgi:hypothetical protein
MLKILRSHNSQHNNTALQAKKVLPSDAFSPIMLSVLTSVLNLCEFWLPVRPGSLVSIAACNLEISKKTAFVIF